MDHIKIQTHTTLTKLIMLSSKQLSNNQISSKQQSNQFQQQQPKKQSFQQFINHYQNQLQSSEKFILELFFSNQLKQQLTYLQFKQKIKQAKDNIQKQSKYSNQIQQTKQNQIHNHNSLQTSVQTNNQSNNYSKNKSQISKKRYSKIPKKSITNQPNVQSNPQYFRTDLQLCHKLFQFYRKNQIDIKNNPVSFNQKQLYMQTLSYNKIIQMFKDAQIILDVPQKLQILKVIKKICFNQKYINKQQFVKIFKCIVYSVGIKQQSFHSLVKQKTQIQLGTKAKNSRQSFRKRNQYSKERYTKMKTQTSIMDNMTTLPISKKGIIKKLQPLYESQKNGKGQLHNSRGVRDGKQFGKKRIVTTLGQQNNNKDSYLLKAMQRNKVMKITWQSLFNTNQLNRPNYINIPTFIKDGYNDQN